jgi:hypothetical protein
MRCWPPRPDPEVVAARQGGIGVPLLRERLYSSLLATWRRGRHDGIVEAVAASRGKSVQRKESCDPTTSK